MRTITVLRPLGCALLLLLVAAALRAAAAAHQIPKWWQWFYYASFISYAWGSLMDNEFGRCPPPACAFGGYDSVVHYFSLGRADGWAWFAYLWAFFALFSLAAWACLRFKVYSKR